jgi:hypothetical protein
VLQRFCEPLPAYVAIDPCGGAIRQRCVPFVGVRYQGNDIRRSDTCPPRRHVRNIDDDDLTGWPPLDLGNPARAQRPDTTPAACGDQQLTTARIGDDDQN